MEVINCGSHEPHLFLGLKSAVADGKQLFSRIDRGQLAPHASISASPVHDSKPVLVEWKGIPSDKSSMLQQDYIALSCLEDEWSLSEAFDFVRVVEGDKGSTGNGSVELPPLPDLRCRYVIRYVRKIAPLSGTILAEAELAHVSGGFGLRPQSLHIGFTERRDEMLVIWTSGHRVGGQPQVEWGIAPGVYSHVVDAASSTYAASDMCNAPANRSGPLHYIDPGLIHRAVLRELPPSTRVYYRVRSGSQPWGAEHSFRSSPPDPR